MKRLKCLVIGLCSTLLVVSCGQKDAKPGPLSEKNPVIQGVKVKKSLEQEKNFKPNEPNQLSPAQSYHIKLLKKKAFEQSYLMSVAQIQGPPAPAGESLANKIVFFERKGNSVYLFEALKGKVVTDSIQTKVLLAEFPIIDEDEKSLTMNFKKGMNALFQKPSMRSSGDNSENHSQDSVLRILNSYIENVELRGRHLFIDQVARVESHPEKGGKAKNTSVNLKYTFSSYRAKEDFPLKESPGSHRVGYFEVEPTYEGGSGTKTTPILKYDERKPIVYHISPNTPEKYLQAIKDGISYWNQAFKKEMIKIKMLPEDISVHEPGYNIIQWMDWDTAGFAYADLQGDPLTGEILQSHVYLTSVFTTKSFSWAKDKYELWVKNGRPHGPKKGRHSVSLRGFNPSHQCQYDHHHSMKVLGSVLKSLESIEATKDLSEDEKQQAFERFAKDYLRATVAHEVGHTLGLRHNFAGSLTTTLTMENWKENIRRYFTQGDLSKTVMPSGTVMDYNASMVAAMNGSRIRQKNGILPYDGQAIQWAYTDREIKLKDFVPFCSDNHLSEKYLDCRTGDQFSNILEASSENWKNIPKKLGFNLAKSFQSNVGRDGDQGTNDKLKNVRLFPIKDAKEALEDWKMLLSTTANKAQLRSLKIKYPEDMTAFEKREYRREIKDLMATAIAKAGGTEKLLLSSLKLDHQRTRLAQKTQANFEKYFQQLYPEATRSEHELALEKVQGYLTFFEEEVLLGVAKTLQRHQFLNEDPDVVNALSTWIESFLFHKSEEIIHDGRSGQLLGPTFSSELRQQMAKVLTSNRAMIPSYRRSLKREKARLYKKHLKDKKILLEGRNPMNLPNHLYNYYWQEKEIFTPYRRAYAELRDSL